MSHLYLSSLHPLLISILSVTFLSSRCLILFHLDSSLLVFSYSSYFGSSFLIFPYLFSSPFFSSLCFFSVFMYSSFSLFIFPLRAQWRSRRRVGQKHFCHWNWSELAHSQRFIRKSVGLWGTSLLLNGNDSLSSFEMHRGFCQSLSSPTLYLKGPSVPMETLHLKIRIGYPVLTVCIGGPLCCIGRNGFSSSFLRTQRTHYTFLCETLHPCHPKPTVWKKWNTPV